MRQDKEIVYTVLDGHDDIIDEHGNQTIRLRKIFYNNNDTNVKLDIRKWSVDNEGEERMGKGLSFLTDDGPNILTEVLAKRGYGNTKTIINNIQDRPDFRSALNGVLNKEDDHYDETAKDDIDDTTYYDPRQCLL